MVKYENFLPAPNQTDVPKTTVVNFTIVDDGYSVLISTLNVSVDGQDAIKDGAFVSGRNGKIFSTSNKYIVGIYPNPPNFINHASKIDVHIDIMDGAALDAYDYSFFTVGYQDQSETIPSQPTRPCLKDKPFFPPTDLGLRAALDDGTGNEVTLEWKAANPDNEDNIVFYNIYYDTERKNVLTQFPRFLSIDIGANIGGLPPGDTHFFSVKASEFNPIAFTFSGMRQAGPDMYHYPEESILDGYVGPATLLIPTNSVDGFPDFGVILIDDELIRYSMLRQSPPAFIVHPDGRGYDGTVGEEHFSGATINLYWGREDANNIIAQATPTFQKPNYALTYALSDGYEADGYRDGYDGYAAHDGYLIYKEETVDSLTTDGTNNDESGDFNRLDYCGTWRQYSPQSFMQGQCKNSYFGGAQVRIDDEGNRHLVKVPDVKTHTLQREELLLETTGEPFVLLRRMWTGIRCSCFMIRREHPDARCGLCFGVGFLQSYIQFFNPRRSDRRILIRIDPATDDLNIVDRGGFEPMYEPDGWTLPFPQIKDRDLMIRFNPDNTEAWRYEVLHVTRNKTFFTQTGAQKLKIKRLPKTSIIYQFPIVRDTSPTPETSQTSSSSASGLPLHSHEIVAPSGANLLIFKGATLESEGHNHIIYNGQVQNVLNHTHTLL